MLPIVWGHIWWTQFTVLHRLVHHSGVDITDKMDLLVFKYRKESRLFDALQELKDDLLDDTAWPVVMQWFNEDH